MAKPKSESSLDAMSKNRNGQEDEERTRAILSSVAVFLKLQAWSGMHVVCHL